MPDLVQQVVNIGIIGTAVSLTMELIKNKFGVKSNKSIAIVIGLSLASGAFVYFFSNTPYWLAFLGVLGVASTFYALFIRELRGE